MKKIPHIFFLIAAIIVASSTTGAYSDIAHTPRDGDHLHPGLAGSHSLILSANDTANIVVVDPQSVSFDDSWDASCYIDGDTISYVQFATKHRFILRADTLSYLGFENRATDFRLDSPATVAVFPLGDGRPVSDKWTGHMLHYGTMMLKHVKGESRSVSRKGWTITDGTDTVRNCSHVIWTLDMSYADPDSIDPSLPDSIASSLISDMQVEVKSLLSEHLVTERTLWFSDEARYPVLTDSRVSRFIYSPGAEKADTVPVSMLAMHYPASFQHSDTGEEIIAQKPKDRTGGDSYRYYDPEEAVGGSSLSVWEPEVSGGTVTITLSSPSGTRRATVTAFSDSGMRLTEPMEVTLSAIPQSYTVNIPAGWTGVILLRVDTGDESYTRKVII